MVEAYTCQAQDFITFQRDMRPAPTYSSRGDVMGDVTGDVMGDVVVGGR